MTENENFLCPHCGEVIADTDINQWKARQAGRGTSEKKATSSAENGKKGGRPRKLILDDFSCDAMKDGKMYHFMLVKKYASEVENTDLRTMPNSELANYQKKLHEYHGYRLIICPPGGGQFDAEIQPENEGEFPDIQILVENNGFDVIDARAFLNQQ